MFTLRRLLLHGFVAALVGCAPGEPGVTASGTVEFTEVDLAPNQPARVVRLLVAEGDRVAPGDTLAVLASATLPAELQQLSAAVAQADAELAELRRGARPQEIERARAALADADAAATRAAADARRFGILAEHGSVSAQQLEVAQAAAISTGARREQARQTLALLQAGATRETVAAAVARRARAAAALQAARAQQGELVLTAPGAGVVTGRYREPGELAPAGRPVLTVADPAAPWVRVYVNQLVLPDVRVGQRGTARLDGPRPSAFAGRVIAISREAEYTPRIALTDEERADLMFGVKLALDDPHGRLRAGLPVTVTLTTADGAHPTGARPRAVALTEATP